MLQVFIFRAFQGFFPLHYPLSTSMQKHSICPENRDELNGSDKTEDFLMLFVPLHALLIEVVSPGIINDHHRKILDLQSPDGLRS
jgi:hypothetical protein